MSTENSLSTTKTNLNIKPRQNDNEGSTNNKRDNNN